MTQELYARPTLGFSAAIITRRGVGENEGGGGATLHAQVEISAMFTEDEGGFKLRSVQK